MGRGAGQGADRSKANGDLCPADSRLLLLIPFFFFLHWFCELDILVSAVLSFYMDRITRKGDFS
jgi:hypothetical protein